MGKAKLNIPMCAALVLLLLTMISIHMTSGLYARYTTTATGSDSARVAKFDVTAAIEQGKDSDDKPIEGQFVLTVTNNSEVAVCYSVEIDVFKAPLKATFADETKEPVDGKITFENSSWTLAPGASSTPQTLTFEVTNWVGATSKDENSGATEPVVFAFDVNIHAEQID